MLSQRRIIDILNQDLSLAKVLIAGVLAIAPAWLFAQQTLGNTLEHSPWLSSQNAAFLTRYDGPRLSAAYAGATYEDGGLADYSQALSSLDFKAGVRSIYNLGGGLVFYGGVGYRNFTGRDMAGSAFIDTYRKPFDLVEYTLGNEGRKHLNQYDLFGSIGTKILGRAALGLSFSYTSADYAKYKDLRHKNSLMDLETKVGVSLQLGESLEAGAAAIYKRSTESLSFGIYGSEDKVYKTLVVSSGFMGTAEAFGEKGYTDKNNEIPLFNDYFGAGLQLVWKPSSHFSWYTSASYGRRSGYYGKKSSFTVSHNEFDSPVIEVYGQLDYFRGSNSHSLKIRFGMEDLDDYSNTYLEVVKDNTARYYEYFQPVKLSNRKWTELSAEYRLDLGLADKTPKYSFAVSYNLDAWQHTGIQYPFCREQTIRNHLFGLSGLRNWHILSDVLSVGLSGSFSTGSGEPYSDGLYALPSSSQAAPAVMEDYLYRNYCYKTSPLAGAGLTARYTLGRYRARGFSPYGQINLGMRRLLGCSEFDSYLPGKTRTSLTLTLGLDF